MSDVLNPPGIVTNAPADLRELAYQLNTRFDAIRRVEQDQRDRIYEFGEMLLAAQKTVGDGNWETWVSENLDMRIRQVQQYQRLARCRTEVENARDKLPEGEALPSSVRGLLSLLKPDDGEAQRAAPPAGEAPCGSGNDKTTPKPKPQPKPRTHRTAEETLAQLGLDAEVLLQRVRSVTGYPTYAGYNGDEASAELRRVAEHFEEIAETLTAFAEHVLNEGGEDE
jgi:hypothetical protein